MTMRLPLALERLVRSLEQRLNRPLLSREPPAAFLDEWQARSVADTLRAQRPELLVTLTTFQRPAELARLIDALSRELPALSPRVFVCVLSDRSDGLDDAFPRRLLAERFGVRSAWVDAREHMGKQRFWRTYQTLFALAQAAQAQRLLSLQDDVELAPDFGTQLHQAWHDTGVADPQRRVLYLFSSEDDEPDGRWIHFPRVEHTSMRVRRTDWFDLQGFMLDRPGLDLLRYWMVPVPAWRWRKDPSLSSGVGRQLTQRLSGRGTVYQCHPPLIGHGGSASMMNPQARQKRSLDNQSLLQPDKTGR